MVTLAFKRELEPQKPDPRHYWPPKETPPLVGA